MDYIILNCNDNNFVLKGPDQKILFLAKVIAFWNLENTGNYINCGP